ncbi:amphi-Trp domain-containing protein [Geodermatophilus sp. SYSU D01045]
MADVKIEQELTLSRPEVARLLRSLAEGLESDDGEVAVRLGNSTVELSVGDRLRCELEVEVDGDEIELELELTWPTSRGAAAGPRQEQAEEEPPDDEAVVTADGATEPAAPAPRSAPDTRTRPEKRRPSPA